MFGQGSNTMDNSCSPSLYVVSLFALFRFSLCSTIHCEVLLDRYLDQLHSSNFILYGFFFLHFSYEICRLSKITDIAGQ
jgi:hypothetical protein